MKGEVWNYTLVSKIGRSTSEIQTWFPLVEGKERSIEVDHSRLVDGWFNKQGKFLIRLVLGGSHKISRSPHLPARNIRIIYRGFDRVVMRTLQVSTTYYSLKTLSLK